MGDNNDGTSFKGVFMEIREALNALGEWKLQGKAGKKVINRL